MLRLLYIEFMKLKRTKILYILPIPALIATINDFSSFNDFSSLLGKTVNNIENYYFYARVHTIMISVVYFALVTSYIFTREYKEGTINSVFTCNIPRIKVYFSKLLILAPIMLLTNICTIFFILIINIFINHNEFDKYIFIIDMEIIAVSVLISLLLMPFFALISIVSKNIIPAFLFSGVALYLTMPLYFSNIKFYIPICAPAIIASKMSFGYSINVRFMADQFIYYKNVLYTSLLLFAILPLILGLLYYNKSNVN